MKKKRNFSRNTHEAASVYMRSTYIYGIIPYFYGFAVKFLLLGVTRNFTAICNSESLILVGPIISS